MLARSRRAGRDRAERRRGGARRSSAVDASAGAVAAGVVPCRARRSSFRPRDVSRDRGNRGRDCARSVEARRSARARSVGAVAPSKLRVNAVPRPASSGERTSSCQPCRSQSRLAIARPRPRTRAPRAAPRRRGRVGRSARANSRPSARRIDARAVVAEDEGAPIAADAQRRRRGVLDRVAQQVAHDGQERLAIGARSRSPAPTSTTMRRPFASARSAIAARGVRAGTRAGRSPRRRRSGRRCTTASTRWWR